MITPEPEACRVVAIDRGDGMHILRFELRNPGNVPIELSTYEPFNAFTVRATAGGKPLIVHQPALDLAVRRTIIRVPAKGSVTLATPIRLRIAEGAEPGTDGFVWTIAHAKESVSLEVELDLAAPFAGRCPVVFRD